MAKKNEYVPQKGIGTNASGAGESIEILGEFKLTQRPNGTVYIHKKHGAVWFELGKVEAGSENHITLSNMVRVTVNNPQQETAVAG